MIICLYGVIKWEYIIVYMLYVCVFVCVLKENIVFNEIIFEIEENNIEKLI